ncbi:hypothetical protein DSECCO2_547250 [anaerobic digester metagenome]
MEATLKIVIEPSSEFLAALWSISAAMLGQKPAIPAPTAKAPPIQAAAAPTAAMSPSILPAPVAITPIPAVPAPVVQAAPVQAAVPIAAPAPVPMPAPAAVPVAASPGYTVDQLARAGTALVDAGKRDQLIALLQRRGVQTLSQLDPAQYGAFATELRGLGAQI